ncbi:hypothetical protein AQUCO_00400392v1 [Aquilegia coerulea]|uniref:Uncharacterized protein n=1 Tax=Aquilegia coerulea TaxID=218851 RepID=A0A2G5EUN9_AQUCA|nr:hypothetical protein AQUCO_00400392v1 [Aquilegia coerulea]
MALKPLLCACSSCKALRLLCFLTIFLTLFQAQITLSAKLVGLKNHHNSHAKKSDIKANLTSCNSYVGNWVQDDTYPMYQYSKCPFIDSGFNCQMYGRSDSDYLKYRWKPATCELPRFNGLNFLLKMRGKTVMFVGDSLGRNQWESMICMVLAVAPGSSTQMLKGEPLSTFKFIDYNVTISFYRAQYLVDIDMVNGSRILRLDEISDNSNIWKTSVDVLSFNTGHWWTHKGDQQGWDYMELEGVLYQDMNRLDAFERGLRTWARWVDTNINPTMTQVFFQGISPTHYIPGEWKSPPVSKNCYGEMVPITGSFYSGPYPDQMKVVQNVIRDMTTTTHLLDITTLSQLRKDAHPSIYSGDLSPAQRANPNRSADCSHWCLPGLPDTWNQLLYTEMFF